MLTQSLAVKNVAIVDDQQTLEEVLSGYEQGTYQLSGYRENDGTVRYELTGVDGNGDPFTVAALEEVHDIAAEKFPKWTKFDAVFL